MLPYPDQAKLADCWWFTDLGKGSVNQKQREGSLFWLVSFRNQIKVEMMKSKNKDSNVREEDKAFPAWAKERNWRRSKECLARRYLFCKWTETPEQVGDPGSQDAGRFRRRNDCAV